MSLLILILGSCSPGPNKALSKCEAWAEKYPETFSQVDTLEAIIESPATKWDTVINILVLDPEGETFKDSASGAELTIVPLNDSTLYVNLFNPGRSDTVRIPYQVIKLTPRGPFWKDRRVHSGVFLGFGFLLLILILWYKLTRR